MKTTDGSPLPTGRSHFILHPTDFSPQSELAFDHALRLALTNKAKLRLLHVGEFADTEWQRFPSVRQTLQRWGLLEAGAERADVSKLGVEIDKFIVGENSVVDAIVDVGLSRPVDLLVLATEQRRGLAGWIHPSVAERAARKLKIPTLFVPAHGRGCVSPIDGKVTMDQVLVPVDHEPSAEAALVRGLQAIESYGHDKSVLSLLHIGEESNFPSLRVPDGPWRVIRRTRRGDPVAEILDEAEQSGANLVVMVTKGTEGFLDALRGTTTEHVLRKATCPVLSIPEET